MKKIFVIYDLENELYWYGWYTNKRWTADIREAATFDSVEETESKILYLASSREECPGSFYEIITVYKLK